ncbi:MAG: DAK2 domain-containing protein [Clostridia bacterium]|nr:DAK2 domain-containing protein [Clostridia bacterium]
MKIRKINGTDLEKMLAGGLSNIKTHEAEINDLNVFPVPDGDTGTNMRLTLENGLKKAVSSADAGTYMKGVSEGMLLGARGNSGVILSQIFKGIAAELAREPWVGPAELRNALIRGYKTAYSTVLKPAEGTILTVTREGIEHIRSQLDRNTSIDSIFAMYIAEMKKSLAMTPELLPVLKEAGVVDSGAKGFIVIAEGMLGALRGELVSTPESTAPTEKPQGPDLSFFDADSTFEYGYCLEFILQLMNGAGYNHRFREDAFTSELSKLGDSLVVVKDGTRIKVHVHTKRPERIIALAREFGEFLSFKLDNMQLQHNEHIAKTAKKPRSKFARIAVVNGDGMKKIFSELGCEIVIDGGRTMNTSSQEFIAAFKLANAETVAVLPCSKNIYFAARQAASMYKESRVEVLEAPGMAEGYYALAMDVVDSTDPDYRISQMKTGIETVKSVAIATASRDSEMHGFRISAGKAIAISGGEIVAVADTPEAAAGIALTGLPDIADAETFIVFCAEPADEAGKEALAETVSASFPLADISFLDGYQEIYRYIICAV